MLIDTHAHLNFQVFEKDRDEVIERTLAEDVWMINIGTNFWTSKKAVEIAENYKKGVFAAIGLHPINLDTGLVKIKVDPAEFSLKTHGAGELEGKYFEKEFDYEKYRELARSAGSGQAQSDKIVAIGEIGLDYYWRPKTTKKKKLFKQKQKELFEKQLALAEELNLPVILHCRMAHDDLIEILKQTCSKTEHREHGGHLKNNAMAQKLRCQGIKGVVHCFTGTWEQAQEYMEMGFYLGFNGLIFKLDFDEIIRKTPLEKILVETDCPYLSPPSFGKERNEPLGVEYVARRIAEIKGISSERVEGKTTENAKDLFGFKVISLDKV